jgi:hypothetical protein
MVETYAILALLISLLAVMNVANLPSEEGSHVRS